MYVYLLKSKSHSNQRYIGVTSDLKKRLRDHNLGRSYHTSKFVPWEIISVTWFQDKRKARKFEKYLKIGSGHEFAKRHLW